MGIKAPYPPVSSKTLEPKQRNPGVPGNVYRSRKETSDHANLVPYIRPITYWEQARLYSFWPIVPEIQDDGAAGEEAGEYLTTAFLGAMYLYKTYIYKSIYLSIYIYMYVSLSLLYLIYIYVYTWALKYLTREYFGAKVCTI